jgi:hypothetical protein
MENINHSCKDGFRELIKIEDEDEEEWNT